MAARANAASVSPSARNLHNNPQILNMTSKRAAHRPCIVVAWQTSSQFNSRGRGCPRLLNDGWWLESKPARRPSSPSETHHTEASQLQDRGPAPHLVTSGHETISTAPARLLQMPLTTAIACVASPTGCEP